MENYLISVVGTQDVDGEKDSIELTCTGEYIAEGSKFTIKYKEYDDDNPEVCSLSTVEVEGDTVTVLKSGPYPSRLLLEKGRRHQCHYSTMFGDLMVGVFTDTVKSELNEKGGRLYVSYSLDFNAGLVSKNEIIINVKEKEVQ